MNRCVVLTGCSSGIGAATATAFLEEEWTVYATARSEEDLADLADAGCRTARLDVTEPETIQSVVDAALTDPGRIDCLVNNAGYVQPGPIEDVPTEELDAQFDVNVLGPHRLTRAVLPHMRERGDGTVVNVSSVLGRVAVPGSGVYCASKFAIEAMSDALRAEVGRLGIDVVLIEPGMVETAFRDRGGREARNCDRTEDYAALYQLIDDWEAADGFGPTAMEARTVADAIVNAASATDPDPRYVVGSVGGAIALSRYLPDRVRDRIFETGIRVLSGRFP